jgi:hypothetical protein
MTGFAGKRGRVWVLVGKWVVPLVMSAAYVVLMLTSETDIFGAAWESLGLVFVLTLWWIFRDLVARAAMSRAVATADTDRVLELAADLRGPRQHVHRAIAYQLRGEWAAALAELDAMPSGPLAATVRIAALVETGRAADARQVYDSVLAKRPLSRDLDLLARLAEARVRWGEGDLGGADPLLARLIDDVRAGDGIRALALHYRARIADAHGDTATADRHRTKAKQLAPHAWFAQV